jgi:DNA sulfur modification protein DndD
MKLLELQLLNFMPYAGEHRVVFPTDRSRNVMVIFGDNMRGKTSFLNAIRWGLYGYALGRHRNKLDLAQMVNVDAVGRGDYRLHVWLRFEEHGHEYDLRRSASPRELVSRPRSGNDYRVDVALRKDGQILRGDQIEHELNQLLPEQISRFFLFDGELLQEYEALLSDDQEQGKRIKEAIEQVLGVPALISGRDELRTLLRQAQTVQARENKHVEGLRSMAEQQLATEAQRASVATDLEQLRAREEHTVQEIEDYDEQLAATEAVQKAKASLDALKDRHTDLRKREDQLTADLLSAMRDAWKDVLQPRLEVRIRELERVRERYRANIEGVGALKLQITQLRALLGTSTCTVCGQPITALRRDEAGAQLGSLEGQLDAMSAQHDSLAAAGEELSRLSKLRPTGAAQRIRSVERDRSRVAVELTSTEGNISALEDQVRGHDTAEIARVRALRDARQQALGRFRSQIRDQQERLDGLIAKQNELAKVMSKNTAARSQRSNREVEVYGALEKTFSQGIDVLRHRLRQRVAELASESFSRLTTERTYRELRINDNYGLSIIDRSGRPVSIRSAGAEQIVALSLIDGLNRTARKTGPIIMDTPLGRLDPKHRAGVLAAVPEMAEQVVLLVHEGEIDRTTGLEPLAARIGAALEIERVSSSESRFLKLSDSNR